MQLIEELPFGLAICAANGETATLTGLSDRQMRLRTHGAEPLSSLAVRFLTDDRASYVACPVDGWRVSHEERTRLGVLRMVDVPCPAFAKEARRALKLYTEYLRLKSLGDDEYLAHALTGCPYVDTTARSFAGQKAAWLRGAAAFSLPGDWTLALTADSFAAYRRFLSLPLDAFQREATLNLPAFARPAGRICIGNAGCPRLFPDRPLLSKLLARAKEQGLNVTIVLPPVSENAVPETERLLACLDTTNADELCVNDLGALALARKTHLTPTLGIQLNRRRKDARLPYKTGCRGARTSETPRSSDPSDNVSATLSGVQPASCETGWQNALPLLSRNGLDDADFREWLAELGVTRFEYEACGYAPSIAPGRHSLHLPFYQTNTSHACPLAAACFGLDPGQDVPDCRHICETRARLYPDELHMVGRYNSLFALDPNILASPAPLSRLLASGVDRIVVNLL
ncbi:MAG: hypothetical protein MR914_00600 [Clostridiales bacterium]|nr:hypothetical protein [Clostridiales bacterium]